MADKLISTLTAATTIADADLLIIETAAGNSRKVTGANAKAAIIPTTTPQGRLTLTSATPVMKALATAQGTVYYSEYRGNACPVYNGSTFTTLTFSNLSLILDSTNQLLENLYDVYLWSSSGTATLGASPAWVNTATVTWTSASPGVCTWTAHGLNEGSPVIFTAGTSTPTGITAGTTYYVSKTGLGANSFSVSTTVANAAAGTNVNTSSTGVGTQTGTNHTTKRGTGAGTTELELKNGLWTNKNAITLYNNSVSSGSITANQATYLGTIYCTANGQTGMNFNPAAAGGGTSNILGVFNAYNRRRMGAICRDSTASWTYATAAWQSSDGNVLNRIAFVDGLAEVYARSVAEQSMQGSAGSVQSGVGANLNNTTAIPAFAGLIANASVAMGSASQDHLPALGYNYIQMMQYTSGATSTYYGVSNSNQLHALIVDVEV